jgi:hypothetical protein
METLYPPVFISSRLAAAVDVAGATVSVEPTGRANRDGKPEWRWYVDTPDGGDHSGAELWGWGGSADMLETLLAFMGACGESVNYARRTGRDGDNAGLFPPAVAEWCAAHGDELSAVGFELAEGIAARRGQ